MNQETDVQLVARLQGYIIAAAPGAAPGWAKCFYQLCDAQTRHLLEELLGPAAPALPRPGRSCLLDQTTSWHNPDLD